MHLAPRMFPCFCGGSPCFSANWEHTRIGRTTSGIVVFVVVSCFLLCFCLRPILCFRGARRSVNMFFCVFLASRKVCGSFLTLGFCWKLSRQVCLRCCVPWTSLLLFGRLAVFFFASWIHRGTHLWGHQADSCPSPVLGFQAALCYLIAFV